MTISSFNLWHGFLQAGVGHWQVVHSWIELPVRRTFVVFVYKKLSLKQLKWQIKVMIIANNGVCVVTGTHVMLNHAWERCKRADCRKIPD